MFRIVTGVIGSDVHNIGNKLLVYALRSEGIHVTELGVSIKQEEFISAAIETNADAILITSVYGHGELDCVGMRDKCIEAGIPNILLYVGGNLVVGRQIWEDVEQKFLDMGFNRVAKPNTSPSSVYQWLKKDLHGKSGIDNNASH